MCHYKNSSFFFRVSNAVILLLLTTAPIFIQAAVLPEDIEVRISGETDAACTGKDAVREHAAVWDFFETDPPAAYRVEALSLGIVIENEGEAASFIRNAWLHADAQTMPGGTDPPDFIVLTFYTADDLAHAAETTGDGTGVEGQWQAVTQTLVFDYALENTLPAPVEDFGVLSFEVVYRSDAAETSSTISFSDAIGTPAKPTACVIETDRIYPAERTGITTGFTAGCPPVFTGDANCDKSIDIADAVAILAYLFSSEPPCCLANEDINDDNSVDIADCVALLSYLFCQTPLHAPDGSLYYEEAAGCHLYLPGDVPLSCDTPCSGG